MKKPVLTVIAIALVVSALFAGPALVDLIRLDSYIKASAKDYEDKHGAWPHLSDACVGCHGVNGNSVNQHYPPLAGQPAAYLAAQLRHFASGERAAPIMNAMARALSESDIDMLAGYFADQPAAGNPYFRPDEALQEQGRQLVATGGCAACHGDGLMGQGAWPRLAGLGYAYLLKEFDHYADGSRRDPTQTMNALAAGWSPDERKAIAAYLASLVPVAQSTPRNSQE